MFLISFARRLAEQIQVATVNKMNNAKTKLNSTSLKAAEVFADKDYSLWLLLHNTRHAMAEGFERELRKYGISLTENVILLTIQAIEQNGGVQTTPAEISRWSFRKPHTISGVLKTMESKGLVKRRRNLNKKNLVRVEITRKGLSAYEQASKKIYVKKILSALSEDERQQLRSCLLKLRNKALKDLGMDQKMPYPQLR